MPQWKVTLATTKKKPEKDQGHSMTLAAASVISTYSQQTVEHKCSRSKIERFSFGFHAFK
jgi:hypothetical protein